MGCWRAVGNGTERLSTGFPERRYSSPLSALPDSARSPPPLLPASGALLVPALCFAMGSAVLLLRSAWRGEERSMDGLTTCLVPPSTSLVNRSLLEEVACLAVLSTSVSICERLIAIVH